MDIHLYNTLTRTKELFTPIDKDLVTIYSCGPTVYGEPHIGNFRAFFLADMVRGVLSHLGGYSLKHVMNITDVGHLTDDGDQGEDKMEVGSRKQNMTVWSLARMYEEHFLQYLRQLNIDNFDVHPRATEHIGEQIDMVKTLVNKGYAYTIDRDGIYIDTTKVDDYGKLAQLDFDGMNAHYREEGAKIDVSGKRNPTDFAIWKFSPRDEHRQMEWVFEGEYAGALLVEEMIPNEWRGTVTKKTALTENELNSVGFPGRHIECSAMAIKHLGKHIDIHTGGIDHIPVHHTNEIAQSECCIGTKKWVNYRLHQQFLNIDGGKMSKSKGDDLSVPGVLAKEIDPLDLRYFYCTGHYRSFLDFTWDSLKNAKRTRNNLIAKLSGVIQSQGYAYEHLEEELKTHHGGEGYNTIAQHLADDLDTVKALAAINTMLKDASIDDVLDILLIDQQVLKLGLLNGVMSVLKKCNQEVPAQICERAEQRIIAKNNKDYALADQLRDQIQQTGWTIKDTADGYELIAQ